MIFTKEIALDYLTKYRALLDSAWRKAEAEGVEDISFIWIFQKDGTMDLSYGSQLSVQNQLKDSNLLPDAVQARIADKLEADQAWVLMFNDEGAAALVIKRNIGVPPGPHTLN